MKKIVSLAALMLAMLPAAAQDTYENARLLGSDLNGTARYVGMGGALDALGADISLTSTNPAGIGMFRHSMFSTSFGLVTQEDVHKFDQVPKPNLSFDQIGFVYVTETSRTSFVNFAFNYHKSRNFDQILSVANQEMVRHNGQGASLGKLAYAKSTLGNVNKGGYYADEVDNDVDGYENYDPNSNRAYNFSQWD